MTCRIRSGLTRRSDHAAETSSGAGTTCPCSVFLACIVFTACVPGSSDGMDGGVGRAGILHAAAGNQALSGVGPLGCGAGDEPESKVGNVNDGLEQSSARTASPVSGFAKKKPWPR